MNPGRVRCYTPEVRILLATTNPGKLAELRRILGAAGIDLIGLEDSASTVEIEVGPTFEENALLKARHYFEVSGIPTIADDSGLEVEALGGGPGIFSARYAGEGAVDGDRIAKLLQSMKGLPAQLRTARFVCAAAFVWDGGEKLFLDAVNGTIIDEPRGSSGFGYDPVFFYPPMGKTFAELAPDAKAEVSHRGQAFRRLAAWLSESGVLDTSRSGDRIVTTAD
jgi:XTP/dITP diphosphohydrolase